MESHPLPGSATQMFSNVLKVGVNETRNMIDVASDEQKMSASHWFHLRLDVLTTFI